MILENYLAIFPASSIKFVTADREFASRKWIDYLAEKKIGFCLKIKANARISDKSGKRRLPASRTLRTAKLETPVNCRRRRQFWNHPVWLSGMRKANGEQVLVVTSAEDGKALSNYCLRWQIETLFGCLKTRGFRLEDTHLSETDRVGRLLALLAIAFCWVMKSGEFVCRQKTPKRKKHGRLEKSIFRVGLDTLRRLFCRPSNKGQKRDKKLFISFLSRT
jgi:Transposase DDE domain.